MKKKRAWILIAKLALAGALFVYLFQTGQIDLARLAQIRGWGWMILAQGLVFLMLLFSFYRWHLLVRAQGIPYRFRETFELGMIGFFFSQFVPGSTGGDVVKAYYVAVDRPEHREAGITTVFLDRVVGLLVLVALGGVAILFNLNWIRDNPLLRTLAILVAAVMGLSLLACLLFFNTRFRSQPWVLALVRRLPFQRVLRKIEQAVYIYKYRPGVVLAAILLSLLVDAAIIGMDICYALALGDGRVSPASFFFLVPPALIAMSFPISPPGGLGVGEWAYSELFRQVRYPHGALIALIQRVNWYLWALWGLVQYLRRRKTVLRAIALGERDEAGNGDRPEANPGAGGFRRIP